jgi:ribonuclease P protein component
MISKKFRLKEKELKKVLHRWKPFFSYGLVLNYSVNTVWFHRFWIVLSAKSIPTNVVRNFFRRYFYTLLRKIALTPSQIGYDMVFVVKKEKFLDKNDEKSIRDFAWDIQFLLKKMEPFLQKKFK